MALPSVSALTDAHASDKLAGLIVLGALGLLVVLRRGL